MSEYQLFCYAEEFGHNYSDSYQQKPYRVFNIHLSDIEFQAIDIPKIKLEFDKNELYTTRYQTAFKKAWLNLDSTEKQKFFDIPYFNWDIFTKITGVEKEKQVEKADDSEIIELNGKKYKRID
jgi:hypothetical protein